MPTMISREDIRKLKEEQNNKQSSSGETENTDLIIDKRITFWLMKGKTIWKQSALK